ncbi:MAG: DUF4286 family protein [Bacteroidetes bacterium]|nr:DUF4286 family protein [Bacteroidota bacterium]
MFIYNVTVNIDESVQNDWINWMKNTHMPDVMKTGCFTACKILKLLYVEDQGHTYSIQYQFLKMSDYENYTKNFSSKLQTEHTQRYKDKYVAFRTILQEI